MRRYRAVGSTQTQRRSWRCGSIRVACLDETLQSLQLSELDAIDRFSEALEAIGRITTNRVFVLESGSTAVRGRERERHAAGNGHRLKGAESADHPQGRITLDEDDGHVSNAAIFQTLAETAAGARVEGKVSGRARIRMLRVPPSTHVLGERTKHTCR